ncbi:hypothetical protein [Streptomyces sp. 147326]|uniref:hypothetical protein n=1 Tax=Streptomyces sp. 147326 TaxID=3074379 RepID=UPI003857397B
MEAIRMYDRRVAMLFEIGIDTSHVTAQATFRQRDMDSLSQTELAVMAAEESGTRADGMTLNTIPADAAQQLTPAAGSAVRTQHPWRTSLTSRSQLCMALTCDCLPPVFVPSVSDNPPIMSSASRSLNRPQRASDLRFRAV